MKLAINILHVSRHCWKNFQRHRSSSRS